MALQGFRILEVIVEVVEEVSGVPAIDHAMVEGEDEFDLGLGKKRLGLLTPYRGFDTSSDSENEGFAGGVIGIGYPSGLLPHEQGLLEETRFC